MIVFTHSVISGASGSHAQSKNPRKFATVGAFSSGGLEECECVSHAHSEISVNWAMRLQFEFEQFSIALRSGINAKISALKISKYFISKFVTILNAKYFTAMRCEICSLKIQAKLARSKRNTADCMENVARSIRLPCDCPGGCIGRHVRVGRYAK